MFRITVSPRGVEADFEVGSISEAIGILQDQQTEFANLVSIAIGAPATPATPPAPTGKPGRKPKNQQPDPATAQAPAPAPIPDAPQIAPAAPAAPAAPDPALMQQVAQSAQNGLEVPAFLQRTDTPPAAAAPPPPAPLPPPAAPPVVPAAPQFVLGGKVADEVAKRVAGSADKGAGMLAWLLAPNCAGSFILSTASIDEAISVLRFTPDDKVSPIASVLGVS